MHITSPAVTALSLLTTLTTAANPYGINPSKPFNLQAVAPDGQTTWQLNTYITNSTSKPLGLRAYEQNTGQKLPKPTNFTLVAGHYGTQMYTTHAGTQYSSDTPAIGDQYTFHTGHDGPQFAGQISFMGQYFGGDYAAGTFNYITAHNDRDYVDWAVCPAVGGKFGTLVYYPARATRPQACFAAILEAYKAS